MIISFFFSVLCSSYVVHCRPLPFVLSFFIVYDIHICCSYCSLLSFALPFLLFVAVRIVVFCRLCDPYYRFLLFILSLLFVLSFLNVCSLFCHLCSYCRSLLFVVVSDFALIITRWSSFILVSRSSRKTLLGYGVQRYEVRRWTLANPKLTFRNSSWMAVEILNSYQSSGMIVEKKIPYRDMLLKKWNNYVPLQHDESCE